MKMLLYTSGYQESVAETLLKVKVKQLQLIKRNLVVCLMFDEVHLKKDISYCNAEDRIIGKHICYGITGYGVSRPGIQN